MFLCRSGRLRAAALDQALKSPGSFVVQVKANRLSHVTVTGRTGLTFHCRRALRVPACTGAVDSTRAHLEKQQPDPHPVPSPGFVITDSGHLDQLAVVAGYLSKSVATVGGDITTKSNTNSSRSRSRSRSREEEEEANVWFTGNWGGVSRRCSVTRTMNIRALSTAAAAKKSDAGEEQATGSNKENDQNLKEVSSPSSSTEGIPEELEPEGGKPNKTQQLKKVFKEYGAVGVSFHIGISLMSLGMFYLLVSSGIDMASLLCKLGFSEAVVRSKMAAGTSTFVLAYAIHKLFAPVRISITLVSVPLIVRYFRKTGLFKPPTPAP